MPSLENLASRGLLCRVEVLSVERLPGEEMPRVRFMEEDGRGHWHSVQLPPGTVQAGLHGLRYTAVGVRVHWGVVLAAEEMPRLVRILARGLDPNDPAVHPVAW